MCVCLFFCLTNAFIFFCDMGFSVREDVNNQKSIKAIGVTLGYHKNAEYQFLTSKPNP